MDSVRSGPFGQIFRPDNFIFGQVSRCTLKLLPHTILLSDLCCTRLILPSIQARGLTTECE